jgi:hypothetical protein
MTKRITDTEPVKKFLKVAQDFVYLVDERNKYEEIEFYQQLYKSIAHLILRASYLPEIEYFSDYHGNMSNEAWFELYNSLNEKLKDSNNYYLKVFDQYSNLREHGEPLANSLSNDICDIYRELAPGLKDWAEADAGMRRGILWEWWLGYGSHWGDHCVCALKALHWLLFNHINDHDSLFMGSGFTTQKSGV